MLSVCGHAHAEQKKQDDKSVKNVTRPIVVELFTSQGCSSCPAAEKVLSDLAKDESLLPLSLHVDYMSQNGWADPLGKNEFTVRQKMYLEKQRGGTVFTPHVVVDGRRSVTGANPGMINVDILAAKSKAQQVPITLQKDNAGKFLVAKVEGVQDGLDVTKLPPMAELYKITYNIKKTTKVTDGANAGKTLTNSNVVTSIEFMGEWLGKTVFLKVPMDKLKDDAVAFILQEPEMGPILGAARFVK